MLQLVCMTLKCIFTAYPSLQITEYYALLHTPDLQYNVQKLATLRQFKYCNSVTKSGHSIHHIVLYSVMIKSYEVNCLLKCASLVVHDKGLFQPPGEPLVLQLVGGPSCLPQTSQGAQTLAGKGLDRAQRRWDETLCQGA